MLTINQKLFSALLIVLCMTLSQLNASTFRQRMSAKFIPESVREAAARTTNKATEFARRNIPQPIQTKYRSFRNTPMLNQAIWTAIPFLAQHAAKEIYYERYLTKQCIDINKALKELTSQQDFDHTEYDKLQHQRKNIILKIMTNRRFEPCTHESLLEFIKTIQQDLGIHEDILIFIGNTGDLAAEYNTYLQIITLNPRAFTDPIMLAYVIAHEFGHHLQYTGDPKTYQSKFKPEEYLKISTFFHKANIEAFKENSFNQETSAEANAAGYLDCKDCLKHMAEFVAPHNELRCSRGYFHSTDFDPYIKRAELEKWQCPAHEKNGEQHSLSNEFMDFRKFELEDFLPQTYDRSGYKDYKPSPLVQAASAKE